MKGGKGEGDNGETEKQSLFGGGYPLFLVVQPSFSVLRAVEIMIGRDGKGRGKERQEFSISQE